MNNPRSTGVTSHMILVYFDREKEIKWQRKCLNNANKIVNKIYLTH